MSKTAVLSSENRTFFHLVAEAAFSNPFGAPRTDLDWKIIGEAAIPGVDRVDQMMAAVSVRVARLEAAGQADIRLFSGEDREIMLIAFLFDAFHRYLDAFDRLIVEQARAGDEPVHVPFARDALGLLARRGYSHEGSLHFFAVFYQIRRAFYFIHRGLKGPSAVMGEVRRRLWSNVFTWDMRHYERYLWDRMEDFSTLLLGETGTGKGAAAAAIGRSGYIPFDAKRGCFAESFTRSFSSLNLSQFPESLLESELFGHRKGAFTGAIEHHPGVLARCSPHGAIFLDEIGDVGIPVQIKLLQVLQDRAFSPVGSHEKLRFRGRVIAATNRPLDDLRRRGLFRDDFYYRLCSDVITLPPLRQRLQEEPAELDTFLAELVQRLTGEDAPELAAEMKQLLHRQVGPDYAWPGNVRELEQAVRRLLLNRTYPGDRPLSAAPTPAWFAALAAGGLTAEQLLSAYCRHLYDRLGRYDAVAERTRLDWRTVKKYIQAGGDNPAD